MGWANLVYRFSVDGWVSRGKFSQAVQDSGRDRAEGTGCVGSSNYFPRFLVNHITEPVIKERVIERTGLY